MSMGSDIGSRFIFEVHVAFFKKVGAHNLIGQLEYFFNSIRLELLKNFWSAPL